MLVSQKSQYALRAIFELAKRGEHGPVKIAEIAEAQAIPPRFLEVILNQLKQSGFVSSRRGSEGGFLLTRRPRQLTVGEIIEAVQGPVGPIGCVIDQAHQEECPLHMDCVFMPMWLKVKDAIKGIYDTTTFEDLVEADKMRSGEYVPCYTI